VEIGAYKFTPGFQVLTNFNKALIVITKYILLLDSIKIYTKKYIFRAASYLGSLQNHRVMLHISN